MRKPDRDANRSNQNIDHGVLISDEFMLAMLARKPWDLISRKTGEVVQTVDAFDLWTKILDIRARIKGEPFIMFTGNVNRQLPPEYKKLGLTVKLSNLCTEITLHTDKDKANICCLASKNLKYFDEYENELDQMAADISDYLDNVVQSFIDMTDGLPGFERARIGAIDERPLGIGVMGFHDYLQEKMIPFESALAVGVNHRIFSKMRESLDKHQTTLNNPCPMSVRAGTNRRNIVTMAIAPTMSIANLCDMASNGIEPHMKNLYSKKLKQGVIGIKNRALQKLMESVQKEKYPDNSTWIEQQWASIRDNEGSVQHLDWMTQWNKDVFKTADEIDQEWVVQHAADRTPHIDQSQSVNLFFPAGAHVSYLYNVHVNAWKKGVKALYYQRSSAGNRASTGVNTRKKIVTAEEPHECLACQ